MSDKKVLVIDRTTWRRGGNHAEINEALGRTELLNDQGLMCCLGFDAIACGFSEGDIRNRLWPSSLRHVVSGDDERFERYFASRAPVHHVESLAAGDAMRANDATGIDESERERRVTSALKALGWDEVQFVN